MNFLNGRATGNTGIMLNLAAEPGISSPKAVFDHLTQVLDANWSGMKAWNYGTRPFTAPGGYWIEYHPQSYTEYGPANGNMMMLTDSYVWFQLNYDTSLQSKIDPAKLIPYAQAIRNQGNGFIYYGQRFTGWDIDKEGIKAIGSTKPRSVGFPIINQWHTTNGYFFLPLTGPDGNMIEVRIPINTNSVIY